MFILREIKLAIKQSMIKAERDKIFSAIDLKGKKNNCVLIRRQPFTLLEVLIVAFILLLIGSVISFKVSDAFKEQKFYKEVNQLVETMRLAQDLMLILNTDVYLMIQASSNGGFNYWLEMEKDVETTFEKVLTNSKVLTTEIHHVSLDPQTSEEQGQLILSFQSGGSMMTKGIFRMSTHEDIRAAGAKTFSVCLKGYPHPIVSFPESLKGLDCGDEKERSFDKSLTLHTMQEIIEDNELNKTHEKPD